MKIIFYAVLITFLCTMDVWALDSAQTPVPSLTSPQGSPYSETYNFQTSYTASFGDNSYSLVNVGDQSSGSPYNEINAGDGIWTIPLAGTGGTNSFTVPYSGSYTFTVNAVLINDSQWGACPGEWINAYFWLTFNGAASNTYTINLPGGGGGGPGFPGCISDQPTFGSFTQTVNLPAGTKVSVVTTGWSNAPGTTDAYYVSVGSINVIGPTH